MMADLELVVWSLLVHRFLFPLPYLLFPISANNIKDKNHDVMLTFLISTSTGMVDSCSPSVIGKIFPFKPSNNLLVTTSIHLFQTVVEQFCISSFVDVQKLN